MSDASPQCAQPALIPAGMPNACVGGRACLSRRPAAECFLSSSRTGRQAVRDPSGKPAYRSARLFLLMSLDIPASCSQQRPGRSFVSTFQMQGGCVQTTSCGNPSVRPNLHVCDPRSVLRSQS